MSRRHRILVLPALVLFALVALMYVPVAKASGDRSDTRAIRVGETLNPSTPIGNSTTTSISSIPNPSTTGSAVMFTATVTGGSTVNEGSVTFHDDVSNSDLGTIAVSNGQVVLNNVTTLVEGTHLITATYSGTFNFLTSNGSVSQRVNNPTVQNPANTTRYCNQASGITIPASGTSQGAAFPYPSNILIANQPGTINAVKIELNGYSSTAPGSLQSLLVGPAQNVASSIDFFSNPLVTSASNVNLVFSDAAGSSIPSSGALSSGTYRPYSRVTGNTYASPAPAGPYHYADPAGLTTLSSIFGNTDANGTWSYYLEQNASAANAGSISSWCVNLTMNKPTLSVTKSHTGPGTGNAFVAGQSGSYTIGVTNSGPGSTAGATVTVNDSLPIGITQSNIDGGADWDCSTSTSTDVTCTSTAVKAATQSFTNIVVTITPALNAASSVTNSASASGFSMTTGIGSDLSTSILHSPLAIVVNDAGDSTGTCSATGTGTCTLRDAINAANANTPAADTITFDIPNMTGCTAANTCTITLGSALPAISDTLTIDGSANNAKITIDGGGGTYHALILNSGKTLTVNALTITHSGSGFLVNGPAIWDKGGTLNVTNSTFFGNTGGTGGAILSQGTLNVTNSTFTNNTAGSQGGAIVFAGTLNITNSTVFGNTANTGGGYGGGIDNFGSGAGTFHNTIVAGNTGGDCGGNAITADAYNLDSDDSCNNATYVNADDIGLASLADNGGHTQTMALKIPSVAIDAGDNSVCAATPVNNLDQRGVTRPVNVKGTVTATCDVGAYEANPTQLGPTFTVNTTADTDDGSCDTLGNGIGNKDCTLREVINTTNAHSGADTITFDIPNGTGCSSANVCSITLTNYLQVVQGDLTIDGSANSAHITIDGNHKQQLLHLAPAITVSIQDMTLANGGCTECLGAAIQNASTLTVSNSTFYGNSTNGLGKGGAIESSGVTLKIINSTFYNNSAVTGAYGGAVFSGGPLFVYNSTFYGNSATGAGHGGAIYTGSTATLYNSIIANSSGGGGDCYLGAGTLTADAHNIDSDGGCDSATTKTTAEIALGALADNGGHTQTMEPDTKSAAIDAGDDTVCDDNPGPNSLDQRGVTRPQGTKCDVGAVERVIGYVTVIKHVATSKTDVASDWTMNVSGVNPSQASFAGAESPGVKVVLDPGAYTVTESGGPSGYKDTYSTDCSGTLAAGDANTCTITNTEFTPTSTPTSTPSLTPTITQTATYTATSTATNTPTGTATNTPTSTATNTPTNTTTNTPTSTTTNTPTSTATLTPTGTPTDTPTATATPNPCVAAVPVLLSPSNRSTVTNTQVHLDWQDDPCATKYKLQVKQDTKHGKIVTRKNNLTVSEYELDNVIAVGHAYYWRVKACDASGCSKWSAYWIFRPIPETSWNRDDWMFTQPALVALR